MNAKDYGRHASGFRTADGSPSKRFMRRLVFWGVVFAACLAWVMTHEACRYPLANGVCSLVAFLGVPLRLLCLVASEAGADE